MGQPWRAETGVGKDLVQRGAEPCTEPHRLEGTDDRRGHLPEQWHLRDAARARDVVLGERDDAAGADPGAEFTQRGGRVRQVHQDQPTDHRVDRFIQCDRVDRGFGEMHCGQALFGGAGARQRDHRRSRVDTENGPGWTDQPGGDK